VALKSSIEWTQSTWNPVTGCTKISPGCNHCYAERMARRLQIMGQSNYAAGFIPITHEHTLQRPLAWKTPQLIFVNSMSDLFHEVVPEDFILQVFDIMERAHWHVFQVLTKRSTRLAALTSFLPWPENVWMGVSVENQDYTSRIDDLRRTAAAVKFISFEPLIGPVRNVDLRGIDWAIVGGESGPGSRPMAEEWVTDIRDQCLAASIPFFFKQWGGTNKKKAGRALKGRTWDQMPNVKEEKKRTATSTQ